MTRPEAEELIRLLGLLERDPLVPEALKGSVGIVRGLALAAYTLAPDDPHSRKVRLVV